MNNVTEKTHTMVQRWIAAKRRAQSAKAELGRAECELSNSNNELGKWLVPEGQPEAVTVQRLVRTHERRLSHKLKSVWCRIAHRKHHSVKCKGCVGYMIWECSKCDCWSARHI